MSPEQLAAYNSASFFDMAIMPALLNVVWVAVYYLVRAPRCCAVPHAMSDGHERQYAHPGTHHPPSRSPAHPPTHPPGCRSYLS